MKRLFLGGPPANDCPTLDQDYAYKYFFNKTKDQMIFSLEENPIFFYSELKYIPIESVVKILNDSDLGLTQGSHGLTNGEVDDVFHELLSELRACESPQTDKFLGDITNIALRQFDKFDKNRTFDVYEIKSHRRLARVLGMAPKA